MTEKVVVKATGRGGMPILDIAMSALAAFAVGFVTFAMPTDIFQGIFGGASRLAVIGGGAALTFIAILALLRALDRLPGSRRKPAEVPAEPPRLRRADAHPDAPSRVPIFARHELGTPLPAEQPESEEVETPGDAAPETEKVELPVEPQPIAEIEQHAGEAVLELEQPLTGLLASGIEISEGEAIERLPDEPVADAPLPSFIAPEPIAPPAAPETIDEAPTIETFEAHDTSAAEEAPEPIAFDEPVAEAPAIEALEAAPVVDEAPTPAAEADFVPASLDERMKFAPEPAPVEPEPGPIFNEEVQDFGSAELKPAAIFEEEIPDLPAEAARAEEAPIEPEPAPAAEEEIAEPPAPIEAPQVEEPPLAVQIRELPEAREESISDLMGRLETGLGRRDRARWLGQEDGAPAEEPPADDRLRSAIGKLRRMAGRKG